MSSLPAKLLSIEKLEVLPSIALGWGNEAGSVHPPTGASRPVGVISLAAGIGNSIPINVSRSYAQIRAGQGRAGWATRLKSETFCSVIAVLLVLIAGILLFAYDAVAGSPPFTGMPLMLPGIIGVFIIGMIASRLGVAGGEFLTPTLVLLFGADIKLAGSLSLAVSLPTMLVGFTRYSMDNSFSVIGRNKLFLLIMAAGSIAGTFIGGLLLGLVPNWMLLPVLAVVLLISAVKVWRHQ